MAEITRRQDDLEDEAIDLRPYVAAVWRRRLPIAAATVLCGIAAFGISSAMTPAYEARAQLSLRVASDDQATRSTALAEFRATLNNQTLAAQVVRKLRLDQPPFGIPAESFLGRSLTLEPVGATNVTAVVVRLRDPGMAAKAANEFASRGAELPLREVEDNVQILEPQVALLKARLDEVTTELVQAKKANRLEEGVLLVTGRRLSFESYRDNADMAAVETRYDVVRSLYTDLVRRVERLRLERATVEKDIQVIDLAQPPTRPVSPRPLRTAAVATLLALVVSVACVLALQLLVMSRRHASAAMRRQASV